MIPSEVVEALRQRVHAARKDAAAADWAFEKMKKHAEIQHDSEKALEMMVNGYVFACDRINASAKAGTN